MAHTVDYSFSPQAGYTGTYRVNVYNFSTDVVVATQDKVAPHSDPVSGSIVVPTVEPYIIRVFALGCDNQLVGTQVRYPQVGTCGLMSAPLFDTITDTTAHAMWGAPLTPGDSYNWYLFKKIGNDLEQVSAGNVVTETLNLTGLVKNSNYRLVIFTVCGTDHSTSDFGDFTTTGPESIGTIVLEGGDDVTLTVRSLTNMNEYGIDGEVGGRDIPFDDYEIIRFTGPCDDVECDHPLFSTFTLDAGNDTETIEVSCP